MLVICKKASWLSGSSVSLVRRRSWVRSPLKPHSFFFQFSIPGKYFDCQLMDNFLKNSMAGSSACLIATGLLNPLEVIKIQIQTNSAENR
jgi:hypothetical protein